MKGNALMALSGWEAFTHGVFAIAVTLLVLDIRVPDSATIGSGAALIDALVEELPRYLAYVIGFLFVGTYWLATHRIMGWMRGVDHWGVILGLLFLMVISAVPFVTALLAEYIGLDDGRDQVGLVVFASWQLILSILAVANFYHAADGGRLLKPAINEQALRAYLRFATVGPVVWIVTILTAIFVGSAVTLVLTAVVLVLFLVVEPPSPIGELRDDRTATG
jgi:TMEM175 potassium channel family protein